MKVNRKPLALSEEEMKRDHEFWSQYSERLVGKDRITYETTPKELCDFVDKVYLRHDYNGFTGDRKFIRDDDAQKGFSKLRTAIGASIYQWRADNSMEARTNAATRQRLLKEAEFAFKQAFAYCPYSEGAFKYAALLADTGRASEAAMVARSFQKMDPYNRQVQTMVVQFCLEAGKQDEAVKAAREYLKLDPGNSVLEDFVKRATSSSKQGTAMPVQDIFKEIDTAIKAKQVDRAAAMLEELLHNAQANGPILTQVAQAYGQMGNVPKAEEAMRRATEVDPTESQSWYNLANVLAFEGRAADSAEALKRAFATNEVERVANLQMPDLRRNAMTNPNFSKIRETPEFKAALEAK
jgi:predicted Zn-dependent protease